jgi:hypothetical protein
MNKKQFVIVIIATFCLTMLLMIPLERSTPDPWADVSGPTVGAPDGVVNMRDIAYEVSHFNENVSNMTRDVNVINWPSWLSNGSTGAIQSLKLFPDSLTLIGGFVPNSTGQPQGILMTNDKTKPFFINAWSGYVLMSYDPNNPSMNITLNQIERATRAYNITDTILGDLSLFGVDGYAYGSGNIHVKEQLTIGKILSDGFTLSSAFYLWLADQNIGVNAQNIPYNDTVSYLYTLPQPLTVNVGESLFLNIVLYAWSSDLVPGTGQIGLMCTKGNNDIMLVLQTIPT